MRKIHLKFLITIMIVVGAFHLGGVKINAITSLPIDYKGSLDISTQKYSVSTGSELEIPITSIIQNNNTKEQLRDCKRKLKVETSQNGEVVKTENLIINTNMYSYKFKSSEFKEGDKIKLFFTLYNDENKELDNERISFTLLSEKKYKSFHIEALNNYSWNLFNKDKLSIPIALYSIDDKNNKNPFRAALQLEIKASDGKTYIARQLSDKSNKYLITIYSSIIQSQNLTLNLKIKNSNLLIENPEIKVDIKNEDILSNIRIPSNEYSINVGETYQVNPEYTPKISNEISHLKWESHNSSIATVDNNGRVTGVKNGETDIDIKAKNITKTFHVKVKTYLKNIKATKDTLYLEQGQTINYDYILNPKNADIGKDSLLFASTNNKVATIDETGKIEALSVGESIISVDYDELSATSKLIVMPKLKKIQLEKTEIGLLSGDTHQISYSIVPSKYKKTLDFTYESSNPSVAVVDTKGKITAVSKGTAVITIAHNDVKESLNVSVEESKTSLMLKQKEISLSEPFKLTDNLEENVSSNSINVKIDNPKVLAYENGNLIPLTSGEAYVTITTQNATAFMKVSSTIQKDAPETKTKEIILDSGTFCFMKDNKQAKVIRFDTFFKAKK